MDEQGTYDAAVDSLRARLSMADPERVRPMVGAGAYRHEGGVRWRPVMLLDGEPIELDPNEGGLSPWLWDLVAPERTRAAAVSQSATLIDSLLDALRGWGGLVSVLDGDDELAAVLRYS